MIAPYLDLQPQIHPEAFVHEAATIIGDVHLDAAANVWPGCVLRGDQGAIHIGERTSIQDGTICHATGGLSTTVIGADVTVGHRALLHGCIVQDGCLIGMGSILLDNCEIGAGSIVGAGALVTANTKIPPGSLVLGSPAKVRGPVSPEQKDWIRHSRDTYQRLMAEHRTGVRHA